jgi:hypothetical protein
VTKCLQNELLLDYRNIARPQKAKKTDTICCIDLTITYFCKRGSHGDCPGEWPVGYENGSTHDCTFDIIIAKCSCQCHT